MAAKIFIACADDAAHASDRHRHDGRVTQVSNSNGNIHAFFNQVHNPINEQHFGRHLRVAQEKVVQNRAKVTSAEQHRRRY
jgi:hypothetical protein